MRGCTDVASTTRWCIALLILLTFPLTAQTNTPFAGVIPIPGTIEAENFDNGGQNVAWFDTSAGNAFGPIYRTTDVDVGQIAAGQYHVGALEASEWVEYTVNVAATGSYDIVARYASAYTGTTTFNMTLDGAAVFSGNQSITSTGSWSTYTTRSFVGNLTAGTHVLRVNFVQGFWNPDKFTFTARSTTCPQPAVGTLANRNGSAGGSLNWTVSASGYTSIQWYRNGAPIVNDNVFFKGANTATLQMLNLEHGRHGGTYFVIATNACPGGTASTRQSNSAAFRVPCNGDDETGPDEMLENVYRALSGNPDLCDWTTMIQTNFPNNFGTGGSYNIPVINAATAFIKEPVRAGVSGWNMDLWWQTYLGKELGRDTSTTWYFGGQEFGSYDYQKYNIASVLAVHLHARKVNKPVIRDLARDWLKASTTILTLAAVPEMPLTLHTKGLSHTPAQPYSGPYSALAGERSPWGFWVEPDRNIQMATAIGWPWSRSGPAERDATRHVREEVLRQWGGFVPPGCTSGCDLNAFGLKQAEAAALRNIISSHTLPADLVTNYLGTTIRTVNPYHFAGWTGVRATLLERSTHNSTAPTMGVAYFTAPKFAGGREAHFLYPWEGVWVFDGNRRHRNGIVTAFGLLDLNLRFMQAWQNGSANHPAQTVTIDNLPPLPARFWVTLYPDRAPAVR